MVQNQIMCQKVLNSGAKWDRMEKPVNLMEEGSDGRSDTSR